MTDIGNIHEEFSLFDPKFLAEVGKMKHKNLAVELLKKLIAEQIFIPPKGWMMRCKPS